MRSDVGDLLGYAISEISMGAPVAAKLSPNPISHLYVSPFDSENNFTRDDHGPSKYLAPMNMWTDWDAVCTTVPTTMRQAPKIMHDLLPT